MTTDCNLLLAAVDDSWQGVARQFWPVLAGAFVISLLATPICRHYALKRGIVDHPDDFLKPHEKPIPYLGGIAIFCGWLGGVLLAVVGLDITVDPLMMVAIIAAGMTIMLVGLFDDLHVMSARIKLVCNIAVAALLISVGLGDDLINVASHVANVDFTGQRWLELAYSVPIALFIIIGTCNATNLIDGLDGLCSGVLGIIAFGFVILAGHMRIIYPDAPLGDERLVLALAMGGAAAGFLPFNRNPAKIFMGDAGSMLLGLNAAIVILMFGKANMVRWMAGALMVFALPVGDMILTLARRWRNGRPLMVGDRSHFYDQLRDRGLSVRKVVAISYLLSFVFALAGISAILPFMRTRYIIMLYFLIFMATVGAVWKFNMTSIDRNESQGQQARKP